MVLPIMGWFEGVNHPVGTSEEVIVLRRVNGTSSRIDFGDRLLSLEGGDFRVVVAVLGPPITVLKRSCLCRVRLIDR